MLYGYYSLFGCKLVEKKPLDVESNGFFFYSINPLAFLIVLWYVSICG